jgi:rRNA maturation RNase YbeY
LKSSLSSKRHPFISRYATAPPAIQFFSSPGVKKIPRQAAIARWLLSCINQLKRKPGNITIIALSQRQMLALNRKYLKHNFHTDVITFDFSNSLLSGDIYISLTMVKENARLYHSRFFDELLRVIIHGVLHLAGYNDKSPAQLQQMRAMEDRFLRLFYSA